jgi:hypothetical protein
MVKYDTLESPHAKMKGNIWTLNFKYIPDIFMVQSHSHIWNIWSIERVKEKITPKPPTNSHHKLIYQVSLAELWKEINIVLT